MKNVFYLSLLSCLSCALTIISPGVNSNYRLDKIGVYKFQESSFYGSKFYDLSAFFLEYENLKLVLDDPNNSLFNKEEKLNINQFEANNVNLLIEFCYDKEIEFDIENDLANYHYKLNNFEPLSSTSYFYPYSFSVRGEFIKKFKPFYVREKYPYQHRIYTTGDDYLMCIRSIVSFPKSAQNKSNSLEILTPRNSLINFSYEFDREFILYKNEKFELSTR